MPAERALRTPGGSAEHAGKIYGFCSDFCKRKFAEDPDKLLARLADAPPAEETTP